MVVYVAFYQSQEKEVLKRRQGGSKTSKGAERVLCGLVVGA